LELQAKHVFDGLQSGRFRSRFLGKGLDFEELRNYTPGDEIRDIAWSATARRGEVFVKKFQEEHGRHVWIIAEDTFRLDFGRGNTSEHDSWRDHAKRRVWLETAAILLLAGERNRDRLGCWITGRRNALIPPRMGRPILSYLHRLLGADDDNSTGRLLIPHLAGRRSPRSLVILLSDFLDESFVDRIMPMAARHRLVAVRMVDPWEIELPNWGLVRWRDLETGKQVLVDTSHEIYRQRFEANARRRTTELRRRLVRRGIPLIDVRTDEPMGMALVRDWPSV
jgi:uncharacterized protein (DUF58 family)